MDKLGQGGRGVKKIPIWMSRKQIKFWIDLVYHMSRLLQYALRTLLEKLPRFSFIGIEIKLQYLCHHKLRETAVGESYGSDLGRIFFLFLPWTPGGPDERSEAFILTGEGVASVRFLLFGGPLTPGDSL